MRMIFLSITCLIFYVNVAAQEELKWKEEVESLTAIPIAEVEDASGLILLTGSSSARMWKDVSDVFPAYKVVNNGFGGSQMHELLYFLDELVINYKPDKILIYEGDNDISAGKSSATIMKTTKKVVKLLQASLPDAEIFFISPKPSLARWDLKDEYIDLNKKLSQYCAETKGVTFIDVWKPMLTKEGTPIEDIFIEDGLHMNGKGYQIWEDVISKAVHR